MLAVRWVHSRPRNGPWESRCPGRSGATDTAERRVPRPPPPQTPRPTHAWACPLWGRGPASLRPHRGLITPPGAVPEPRVQPPTCWSPPLDTPRASDSRHSPAPLSPNCPSVPPLPVFWGRGPGWEAGSPNPHAAHPVSSRTTPRLPGAGQAHSSSPSHGGRPSAQGGLAHLPSPSTRHRAVTHRHGAQGWLSTFRLHPRRGG